MNLLDLFRKKPPAQTLFELRHVAVVSALTFRVHTDEKNHQLSSNAGAELLYFLLHIVDTAMHQGLSPANRARYFDSLTLDAIRSYAGALLTENAPDELRISVGETMLDRFNARQLTYSRCTSMAGDVFPTPGSKLFALAFLIHRALGRTERAGFDAILAGTEKINESGAGGFPSVEEIVQWSAFAAGALKSLDLARAVRRLR